MTSRLFITGGSGFLGRNLVADAVARGVRVVALARSPRSATAVEALGATAFEGGLLSNDLARGMEGCDTLVHAAADTGHGADSADQDRVNLEGTRNVFDAARRAGVVRALQISTEAVLLDGRPLVDATETHEYPVRPAGAYSRTKAEAERIALSFDAPGFAVMALRPRFVWGRDDTTALPQLVAAARSGKLVWISGGRYLISTTHVGNVCAGARLALERGRAGNVYFVTDGEPIEFRTFITRLLETQGVAAPTRSMPRWMVRATARAGDWLHAATGGRLRGPLSFQEYATLGVQVTLDIGKARTELGYVPVVTRDEGFADLERRRRTGG
jgi:nucleoside-diphosphate-sugar epimerase